MDIYNCPDFSIKGWRIKKAPDGYITDFRRDLLVGRKILSL